MTSTVPLRRRSEMVLATSARGLSTAAAMPLHRLVADQVADVGDDPGRAGLDELVVVELIEVVRDGGDLLLRRASAATAAAARGLRVELIELRLLVGSERRRQRLQRDQVGVLRGVSRVFDCASCASRMR